MPPSTQVSRSLGDDGGSLFRFAGVAGLAIGLSYPAIIALYILAGTDQPVGEGGVAWLQYMTGNTRVWWGIIALSAFTDLLWIPVAYALYVAQRSVARTTALAGATLMVAFAVLEVAVSWPSYAILVELSQEWATASDAARQASLSASADYTAVALSSPLLPYYAIVVPGVGQTLLGWAILRGGPFPRGVGYLAIVVGVLGVISVVGAYVVEPLGLVIIPASLLSGVWFFVVGWRLARTG